MVDGAQLVHQAMKALELRSAGTGTDIEIGCREAVAAYGSQESDRSVERFLFRYGVLRSARGWRTHHRELDRLLDEAEKDGKWTRERALTVIRLFAGGVAGAEAMAVCGNEPDCGRCLLRGECRHGGRGPRIRDLPERERPRERLIREGPEALSAAELLAVIIRDGTPRHSAVELGQRLLAGKRDLRELGTLTVTELRSTQGIGQAKAAQILAAFEIGRRIATAERLEPGEPVSNSRQVFERYSTRLRDEKKETFLVVLLDRKNRVIQDSQVSVGTLSSSIVHPREVLRPAIRESAAAMICVHNHPSGDPRPSPEDIDVTRRLSEACRIVGISLLDHVVVGEGRHFSFADEGLIRSE